MTPDGSRGSALEVGTSTAAVRGDRPAGRPWTQACVDALPFAPAWTGCAFAAGHVLLGALYFRALVIPRIDVAWSAYQNVVISSCVFALIVGYAIAALAYARRAHQKVLDELRPALRCDEAELAALRREVRRFDGAALRRIGLVWAIGAVVITYSTTEVTRRLGPAAVVWVLWQNAIGAWLLVRTLAHDLRVSGVLSRAAERHAAIELFDATPLAPLARRGLQGALLVVLALSLFSLILGAGDISPLVPVIQVSAIGFAAFALARPSLGVRRRIREAKRAELRRLAREIRGVRADARGDEAESRLATLLALRSHVESAREWPFDVGTLGRFLLYAVIGMGSWLGGAAVERLLDRLLG